MRDERFESFCRHVGAGGERIGDGFGQHAGGLADVRADEYARVIPHGAGFAETLAYRDG